MHSIGRQITEILISWRMALLVLGIVLAAAAFFPAGKLVFDRSLENMFAPDDPLLAPYARLKRTFGGNEIVLAVYADEDLFARDGGGMRRLSGLGERLKAVPGVRDVVSLDQPMGHAVVEQNNPAADRLKKLFEGYTHSTDGRTSALACILIPQDETDVPRRELIERLRSIIKPLPSGMITGGPVMLADGFRYIEQDGRRLGWVSTILLAATILLCFRSLRWVIIPIAVVQLTLLLTKATLVWSGLQLSMVSSMLTAIVTVVGIATVVHVIVRFRDARADGMSPRDALAHTGGLLAVAIFWACSTDAVGFASLTTAEVGPVQDFGLMMAVGSLLVVVSVALLLPALALMGRADPDPKRAWGEGFLDAGLDQLLRWVRRWPKTVVLTTLLVASAAAAGVYRLEVETDFTRNFRAGSPIVRSYQFVEKNLGGAGVWDVILPAPKRLNWDYVCRVRRLEDRLRTEVVVPGPDGRPVPGLTKVLSLADAVLASASRDIGSVRLSSMRNALVRTSAKQIRRRMPVFVQTLYAEDPQLKVAGAQVPGGHCLRIMLRARESQPSAQKRRLIEQVERISREEFPPDDDSPGAQVTGFFVLLTNLIDSMVRDQWTTFGVAMVGIALMMMLALRSPLLALAALIPNALPIVVVTGLMGWLGLKINMGAAMIAAVSLGLSIDSSIHYITAFRRARGRQKPLEDALSAAHQTAGRAMVFSTLALIVGFSVLCISQFVPTVYFGVLVSLSMLGGLAGNLVVLPVLLTAITREKAGTFRP